jgi:hypothetical protein
MSKADERQYADSIARMTRWMKWLAFAGVPVAAVGWGWRAGLGFAIGAGGSYAMFRWLHHFVEALSGKPAGAGTLTPARRRVLVLFALRYLIMGAGLYVIFKFSKISLMAALWGLFVSTAAALAEGVFELLHGTGTVDHQDL